MDNRRPSPYVSCMKIRGVPIIPPLMTEDLKAEMLYYKRLAIAVEDRLRSLEHNLAKGERSPDDAAQESASATEDSSGSESVSERLHKTVEATSTDIPANDVTTEEPEINAEKPVSVVPENVAETTQRSWKSLSDDETNCRNDATTLDRTASSEAVTCSTDINQYLNGSSKSDGTLSTLENSPEAPRRKPEVPKTLNIVPITVESGMPSDTDACQETKNGDQLINEKPVESSTSPESGDETPKLVRQGSYVLETPSPMLLAHMREEVRCAANYVPTSASGNSIKRKEWNISQAKSDWELQRRKDNFAIADSSRGTPSRIRRNSASSATNRRPNGFPVQSTTGQKHLSGTRQVARSADCIQSIMHRECNMTTSRSCANSINSRSGDTPKRNGPANFKSSSSVSILSMANKLGGSLGSLSGTGGNRACKRTPQKQRGGCRMSKSFDESAETKSKSSALRGSARKLLSAVTSDKLVDVFKEIQNTHERQMIELMARQQKEQQNMQKEFEKQQLLLLAQIEQSFPGICLPRLAEKISIGQRSESVERDGKMMSQMSGEKNSAPPKLVEMNGTHDLANGAESKCPLDDIYPRDSPVKSPPCQTKNSRSTQSSMTKTKSPPIGLYTTSVLNGHRWQSGVNRQLFPLESRTRHVPVMNVVYEERHIKAATIITAYVRGYLIRRLMKTDRVVELKTTYKEALHCMLKLHVDAPLALPELNFHQRLQLQCDAASMNIVELFAQSPARRMKIIRQDREIKRARQERPNSARSSYSFATQRTLARKKLKEMGDFQTPVGSRPTMARTRCQTWASNARDKRPPSLANQGIKRSTSAGAVRKPWR